MVNPVAPSTTASRASSVTGGIGLNLHLQSGQHNAYDTLSVATMAADLHMLGVTTIRDNTYDPALTSAGVLARYAGLTQAGFHFDLCVGSSNNDLNTAVAGLDAFARQNPGALLFVEGPNEINYNQFTYAGMSGQSAAIAFQSDLYQRVQADPLLAGVKVLDFTGGGRLFSDGTAAEPIAGLADLANVHVYPANGDPPAWYVPATYNAQYGSAPTTSFVTSEAGYNSDRLNAYGVPEDVQAKQTVSLLLDLTQSGSIATFFYEAFDLYSDMAYSNFDDHWGLFASDGTPKLVAQSIGNLVGLLGEVGADGRSFTPDALDLSISGLPNSGHSWLLEKPNGVFDLVLWAEPFLWNSSTQTESSISSSTITLDFGRLFSSVRAYDPLNSNALIASSNNARTTTISLSDHAVVVELSNNVSVAPTVAPPDRTTVTTVPVAPLPSTSIYRFFDKHDGTHLLTASTDERDSIIATRPDLVLESSGFAALSSPMLTAGAEPIFRFFNKVDGTHFFTANSSERDTLQASRADLQFEGIAFYESVSDQPGELPVYRFFDSGTGTHLYTASAAERASIISFRPDLISEGVAFFAPLT